MNAHTHRPDAATMDQVTDPVCGMKVDPSVAEHAVDHRGEQFYFCSAGCKGKFLADPGQYTGHGFGPCRRPRRACNRARTWADPE